MFREKSDNTIVRLCPCFFDVDMRPNSRISGKSLNISSRVPNLLLRSFKPTLIKFKCLKAHESLESSQTLSLPGLLCPVRKQMCAKHLLETGKEMGSFFSFVFWQFLALSNTSYLYIYILYIILIDRIFVVHPNSILSCGRKWLKSRVQVLNYRV